MFSRFARAQDASSRTALSAIIGGTLLVAWALWFFFARVSLYETSRQARIEVEDAPHDVDAPVAGRLLRTNLVLDRLVSAGDVLIEMDSEAWRLELQAEQTKMLAVGPQVAALERELMSDEDALRGEDRALLAEVSEARARQRASDAVAHLRASEREQVESLHKQHVIADVERQRSQADLEKQTAESEAARAQVGRLGTEGVVRRNDRRAKIARLEADIARLQSVRTEAESRTRILEQRIELFTVRAPVSGRIGHTVSLQAGAVVAAGTRLCTIVPSGNLRAVAFFDVATAAGRVKPDQAARLRLFGFPWTKFGVIRAHVERVGTEPRDGLIRVELELDVAQKSRIPVEHGLQGSAEVEVEKVAPVTLVLDAAGRYLMNSDTSTSSVSPAQTPAEAR
ncbi:MAG TPA: HlyD family efflux transporter periplasmic adaptor subunit [Polyangia bacterium]